MSQKHKIVNIQLVSGLILISFLAYTLSSCATGAATPAGKADRPSAWAEPMKLPGVDNLHKIRDGLYRSAQPTSEGMQHLDKMGIKTVINLRSFHSDSDEIKGTGLLNEELSVKAWHIEDEDVIHVLRTVTHKERGPFLIHCQHGADRTGVMSAMYRIVIQGWTKEEAIREMVNGGYGFHPIWSNIITYVQEADVEKIKRELKK
jgi:protein tyrosine/serine phosphatase